MVATKTNWNLWCLSTKSTKENEYTSNFVVILSTKEMLINSYHRYIMISKKFSCTDYLFLCCWWATFLSHVHIQLENTYFIIASLHSSINRRKWNSRMVYWSRQMMQMKCTKTSIKIYGPWWIIQIRLDEG